MQTLDLRPWNIRYITLDSSVRSGSRNERYAGELN